MRSFVEVPGRILLPLTLAAALAACGGDAQYGVAELPAAPMANGPASDYPMVIGEPYTVAGVTYEPQDLLNYDEVGYISLDPRGGNTISGEHHTLPLPSYVEVTSLESGRTILIRLERRGPMTGNFLIGLSQPAASQLGVIAGAPVRVRRVNPPEQERALLRAGGDVPPRMDTPLSLVNVLRRKLPNGEAPLADGTPDAAQPMRPATAALADSSLALPPLDRPSTSAPAQIPVVIRAQPTNSQVSRQSVAADAYIVQAGAFSNQENANRVARVIGGEVSKSGSLYRVRTGPFASRRDAEASLAKVRGAGYSDARIFEGG
jgi:rare lipoprotein A